MKYMLAVFFLFLITLPATKAAISLTPIKVGQPIELIQLGGNGSASFTFCNISSVKYPNSTTILSNVAMTPRTTDFNYTLNGSNTQVVGTYIVNGLCGVGGSMTYWAYDFQVTPSGSDRPNSGEGLSLIGILFIMVIVAGFFLIIAGMANNQVVKSMFIGLSAFIMAAVVFFGMTTVTQVLGAYNNLISGYYTFFFFMLLVMVVGVFATVIFVMIRSMRQMKIRNGDLDPDNFRP